MKLMILTSTLLFLIVPYTHGQTTAKDSQETLTKTGDVSDVQLIDQLDPDSKFEKLWQPFIAKWSEEHYVVAYGQQLKDKTDMGDIVCSISKDQGKTWSTPITIFDHSKPNGSPAL